MADRSLLVAVEVMMYLLSSFDICEMELELAEAEGSFNFFTKAFNGQKGVTSSLRFENRRRVG